MTNAYRVAELIVFAFAASVLVHTLTVIDMGGAEAITTSPVAYQMAQDLVYYRATITGALIIFYTYLRFTQRPVGNVLAIVAVISWIAFIEDYIALDNIFFLAESLTGKAVQGLRPIYLMTIVFMAVDAYRRENRYG